MREEEEFLMHFKINKKCKNSELIILPKKKTYSRQHKDTNFQLNYPFTALTLSKKKKNLINFYWKKYNNRLRNEKSLGLDKINSMELV